MRTVGTGYVTSVTTQNISDTANSLFLYVPILCITKDIYDKKLKEYKDSQYELNRKLQEHTQADESYHITASTVFSLANRALEIFESSEPQEKRELLGFLLQNCTLDGKKLDFTLRSPFNVIQETAHQPIGLPLASALRTFFTENQVLVPNF